MTNSGNLFSDDLTDWLLEAYSIQSQFQMSVYYNYTPYVKKFLFHLMFITVYIGILMKLSENGLWVF